MSPLICVNSRSKKKKKRRLKKERMLKLRVRAPKKSAPLELEIAEDAPWIAVLPYLSEQCEVDEERIRVLRGFPPKPLEPEDSALVKNLGLRANEMIIVQEGGPRVHVVNTGERYVQLSHERAHFRRRNCPADNSCLFHSCAYVLKNKSRTEGQQIRVLCIEWISTHQAEFKESTGEDPIQYCEWLANTNNWGGYVELGILSTLFQTEIVVLDIQSNSMIRCGQEHDYPLRAFVVFTGTHYDAVAMSTASSLTDETHDQVLFNRRDEAVFNKAHEFMKEEREAKAKA